MESTKVYETDNADLASFLMFQGIEFLGCRIDRHKITRKPVAVMQFDDTKEVARDLERTWYSSPEKRYRDVNKYMLREIHKAVKDFSRAIINGDD